MRREDMADLAAFAVVVDERNFTRAATKLGLSQSALSQIVKRLEERLGVPLIARTTRSVAPTPAGERLWQTLAPMLRDLDQSLIALGEFRDKPSGTIRITSVEHAAKTLLLPAVAKLIADYPDINVEVVATYELADVVAEGFDAGVRLGEHVSKDMVAVRMGPDIPMAIVGAPGYLNDHPVPRRRTISPAIAGSICGCRRRARSMLGGWSMTIARFVFASTGRWSSTRSN